MLKCLWFRPLRLIFFVNFHIKQVRNELQDMHKQLKGFGLVKDRIQALPVPAGGVPSCSPHARQQDPFSQAPLEKLSKLQRESERIEHLFVGCAVSNRAFSKSPISDNVAQSFFSRPWLSTLFIKKKRITMTQLRENSRSAGIQTTKKVTSDLKQT